ncbi:putative polyketide synthase [Massarina eburnea CBS 473.64]|uniref:Putative polyketide synthase n=1 Tax=Massarina eburnea CBS 473.64 TaxID=1395130 RepID=A0A6A6S8J5_9PLEO|nr:putative polyketide synthase [Massarina eburnea CBS 473.64]
MNLGTSSSWSKSSTYSTSNPPSSSVSEYSDSEHHDVNAEEPSVEPIAIIGLSLKLPGDADNVDTFWDIMMEARSTASTFPKERINHPAYYNTDPAVMGSIRPRKGHFIKQDLGAFDADFFGISAEEATAMDPQQRGMLETSYRALENAGISMRDVYGSETSVYTGCFTADYTMLLGKDPELAPKYAATGVAATMLSNRISSFFNLRGPSATIDTACSSSMVALDQACQSLTLRQSSLGIVGGCNLIFSPDLTIGLSNMGFLSPDGVCHSFDHKANGYARGEGFGIVIIKRLSDAIRDGDTIRAVIRSSGTNQDGNSPLARPDKHAQARLISSIYRRAGLDMSETRYVEAHGTGTAVGDPVEAYAIGTSFSAGKPKAEAVYVSSLKANFGHLEGAAGIAGVIKTVLALERGIIPPLAGFEKVNPNIDVEFLNIKFPLVPTPWPTRGLRRASVNSFGFGGTNSHVVIDDAYHYMRRHRLVGKHCTKIIPPDTVDIGLPYSKIHGVLSARNDERDNSSYIFAWSATEESTLKVMISNYTEWFRGATMTFKDIDLRLSLAHTLLQRRTLHSWRSFAVANAHDSLSSIDVSKPVISQSTSELSLAFVFAGQGSQWCGMGRELFVYEPFKRSVIDAIVFLMGLGCYSHLAGAFTGELAPESRIDEPSFAQPLCTIVQVALVELLASVNIKPSVVIGHSSGEIAAAYASGAISRESAWKLAYFRGVCVNKLAAMPGISGAMATVALSEQKANTYLDQISTDLGPGNLTIACVNSPSNVTVSGNRSHVEALVSGLEKESVFARLLRIPVAYHGPLMNNVAEEYRTSIGRLDSGNMSQRAFVNMVSSVTGERVDAEALRDPGYWVQNMVSPVQFAKAIQTTFAATPRRLPNKLDLSHLKVPWATDIIEIGPHGALSGPIRESLKPVTNGKDIPYWPVLIRKKSACATFLNVVGRLHCRGYAVQISKMNSSSGPDSSSCITLPNLPQYPFNHSRAFWYESRLSKGVRFRPHGKNAFIGSPVADWNPKDARWRHFLKPNASSWIADHKVNGMIIFPAAGMLTMAIEGAAQLVGDDVISGFEISDTIFHSALDLPADSDGVEIQLQLLAHDTTAAKYSLKHDWFLRMFQNNEWTEVCRGTIRTVLATSSVNDVDHENEQLYLGARVRNHFDEVSKQCSGGLDWATLNDHSYKGGYHLSSSFKRIKKLKISPSGETAASVAVLERQDPEIPTIIHPATLYSILLVMLPSITQGSQFVSSLPTRINKLWISKHDALQDHGSRVNVAVKMRRNGLRNTTADIAALAQDRSPLIFIDNIEATSIADGLQSAEDIERSRRSCWNIIYKPDVRLLDQDQLERFLTRDMPTSAITSEYKQGLNCILDMFIEKATKKLIKSGAPQGDGHLLKYFQWMQQQLKDNKRIHISQKEQAFKQLYHSVRRQHSSFSKVYYRTGEHLVSLLDGRSDLLGRLFQGPDMSDFYNYMLKMSDFITPLHRYLDLLTHQNPAMSILEVGAGTGSATKYMMKSLTQNGSAGRTARYARYCFTDISSSFFSEARNDFALHPKMDFKVLDLEHDPLCQDFEPASFDIIVASLVLHATVSLDRTLAHLRTLLKPGGKLIAVEVTAPDVPAAGFVFGLLPSWWLSQDQYRKDRLSPCLTPEEWHKALGYNGFSGVDHVFWDMEDEAHRMNSLWISTKVDDGVPLRKPSLSNAALVSTEGTKKGYQKDCEQYLQDHGISPTWHKFATLSTTADLSTTLVIVLDSLANPILDSLSETDFENFHKTLLRASNVLWISVADESNAGPAASTVHGLARKICSENSSINFTIFESDAPTISAEQNTNIHRIISQCLSPSDLNEPEVVEKDGMIQIPRVVEDVDLSKRIKENGMSMIQKDVCFGEADLRLSVKTPGLLDSLYFEEAPARPSELSANEIRLRVKAIGVNFKDCLVALGRVSDNTIGTECSGVVEAVGYKSNLRPGDKVAALVRDTYRSVLCCDEALVVKIPDNVPFTEAAKLPTNFVTAYRALIEVGQLCPDDSVLVHAGAGGTGQAAIQIAQNVGAEVFVSVGSAIKKELVMALYSVPGDHIFYSRDTSFAQGIKHFTGGRGVDVVLNSLTGEELRATWECIAPYGRFLEIGKRDILAHEQLPMFHFAQNVSFAAIDIASMAMERPHLVQKTLKAVVSLFEEKRIKVAIPLKVFKINQVEDAFRHLQSGHNAGCVAIEVDQDAVVPALLAPTRIFCLSSDATYVIAGGFSSQGKGITKWMVLNGAKHIIILSGKDTTTDGAIDFLEEMKAMGVHVEAPACDIRDAGALREAFQSIADRMPPIKGCIQAAMVIHNALLESMAHKEWRTTLDSKATGSWNLHTTLPSDLDFFILLSSTSDIIGSASQANYAAGNTYQDGLARYRLSRGQKAVTLDLGVMADEQDQLFTVLEHYCDPKVKIEDMKSQVLMGLALPADYIAKGEELASWMDRPLFSHLHQFESSTASAATSNEIDLSSLQTTTSRAEAGSIITSAVRHKLACLLSRPVEDIESNKPLHAHGVDSIVAVELRSWFSKSLKADVPMFEILGGGSIEALGLSMAEKLAIGEVG